MYINLNPNNSKSHERIWSPSSWSPHRSPDRPVLEFPHHRSDVDLVILHRPWRWDGIKDSIGNVVLVCIEYYLMKCYEMVVPPSETWHGTKSINFFGKYIQNLQKFENHTKRVNLIKWIKWEGFHQFRTSSLNQHCINFPSCNEATYQPIRLPPAMPRKLSIQKGGTAPLAVQAGLAFGQHCCIVWHKGPERDTQNMTP